MATWVSSKAWGGASTKGDKIKPGTRKPRDASEAIRWKKSQKAKPISRAKAKRWQQP